MAQHVPLLLLHRADYRGARVPGDERQRKFFIVNAQHLGCHVPGQNPAQALLRLADGDHFRRHVLDGRIHVVEIDYRAESAAAAQLRAAPHNSTRAQIFKSGRYAVCPQIFEHAIRGAHDDVLEKRIRNLNRALVRIGVRFVERDGRERGAPEPAGVGRFADEHDIPSGRSGRRGRMHDPAFFDEPDRHDVDQTIVVEPLVEIHVAGDVRYADRVAVRGDAVDNALRHIALMRLRILYAAKTQRIGDTYHFRAHA